MFDFEFSPWSLDGDNCVVLAVEHWIEPEKWNEELEILGDSAMTSARARVKLNVDVFEDWSGPMVNHELLNGWKDGIGFFFDDHSPSLTAKPLTMKDVRRCLFELIDATPNLDWLLLTKWPENIRNFWSDSVPYGYSEPAEDGWLPKRSNVWLGTTAKTQDEANKQIPELLKCRDLSPVLVVNCEPLLGPLRSDYVWRTRSLEDSNPGSLNDWTSLFANWLTGFKASSMMSGTDDNPSIDWVVAGGGDRPSHPDWFRSLRDQCLDAGVPYYFTQWGEFRPADQGGPVGLECEMAAILSDGRDLKGDDTIPSDLGASIQHRVGAKVSGRLLDGVEHSGLPKVAR